MFSLQVIGDGSGIGNPDELHFTFDDPAAREWLASVAYRSVNADVAEE